MLYFILNKGEKPMQIPERHLISSEIVLEFLELFLIDHFDIGLE